MSAINVYMLIFTDGYKIETLTYNDKSEAVAIMKKAYNERKIAVLDGNSDENYIDETSAFLRTDYDVFVWKIVKVCV